MKEYVKRKLFFNFINYVEIEISSKCNRHCSYCPSSKRNGKGELISLSIVKKILIELKSINFQGGIAFHQYNEPLLELKHLFVCMNLVKKYLPKAKMVLYTNGDLLTKSLYKDLKRNGINEFHISRHMEKWNKDDAIKEIKAMKRKIGLHGKKSLFISESKVALVPSKLRRLCFNIKQYNFWNMKKYPTITYIESTDFSISGSNRMGSVETKYNNCNENPCSFFCQSMLHSMHISYRGNAYFCWDCCDGIKESEKYLLGKIVETDMFELFFRKCKEIGKVLQTGVELKTCQNCVWNN